MEIPNEQEVIETVKLNSSAIQFKNSLTYIQGGTNVSLDRMIARFDIVLAQVYLEGFKAGLEFSKAENEKLGPRVAGFTPAGSYKP